jgi:hypothetical protein
MRRVFSAALLLSLASAGHAQEVMLPGPVRAAADGIAAARLARDLEFLAADALLGRNTPSPGFDTAAAYIARRLRDAGLTPLGDDGTYFQHYELRDERIDSAAAYLEIAGQRFRFGDDFIFRSFAGPLTGTLPVVYVGHGWSVPGDGIDPYRDVDVRGKLMLVHGPEAPASLGLRQVGRITANASSPMNEARRRGAAGIIFMPRPPALAGWDALRRAHLARLELYPIVPSAYAAAPVTSVTVRPHVLAALLDTMGTRGARAILGDTARVPAAFEVERQVTVHVPLASSEVHRPYNVVALIEGSDSVLKHEYITIASHLDGAVGRIAQNGDSIYNSADDNASGSAGNLAIAEQMMKAPRPKRSLIFIWDSGEERGLWGTRHFVHAPPVPLANVVAHFNIDMIGANRAPGSPDSASVDVTESDEVYLTGPGVLSAGVDSLLQRVNRAYLNLRLNRAYDRADHEFFYPRTDAGPFLERGVLTIGYFTGLHRRYHAPSDEAHYLDPRKIEVIARSIFAAIWMLADAAERPLIDKAIPSSVPRYE